MGGHAETITLSRLQDGELVDVERWTGRDELAHALEAPVWGRYGSLVGQPPIDGAVIWTTQDRRVGLKRLAREMKCPVIAVAQLSRAVEQRPDKGPVLSDLREPGQIEANADCVMMLYRDDYYDRDSERPGEMDVIVRKNRQGRVGQLTTRIDGRLRYLPVARDEPS